jgi:hypothetical protein
MPTLPGLLVDDVQNVRVLLTRTRPLTRLTVVALATALSVAACSSGADDAGTKGPASGSSSGSPTVSPTADVSVPPGVELTAQGTDLSFGETATVVYEPEQDTATVLSLTVEDARPGSIDDFKGFILDDPYKKNANYYYVHVMVENVGTEDVGGASIPLWGVNAENTLLPAVNFTTRFKPCASTPLPDEFAPGEQVDTCLVYLSPDKGDLEALSFRPNQAYDPIEWTGELLPPKKPEKKGGDKNGNKN